MLLAPFPYIANTAGWMTAELGRQPWLIYGLLRTVDGYSKMVSAGNGWFSFLGFLGMYTVLSMLFLFLVLREIQQGPDPAPGDIKSVPGTLAGGAIAMATIWFMIVAVMVAVYVLLDGFDLGAGAVHLFIAKNDEERSTILRAIGPVWDGNEVWLLAAGGTLYFAFPLLYASSFSGFYLPLMMVLWLLMLRAIGIEFRTHLQDKLWRGFFDAIFGLASILLAIFFGAALGNVVRGVPLHADGYFFEPLWTNWRVGEQNGILDWYTVICGVVALVTLTVHGSLYLATKTEGELNRKARKVASAFWPVQALLTIFSLIATVYVVPSVLENYSKWPIGYLGACCRGRESGVSVLRAFPEEREGRIPGILHLHRRHAGGSGIRALSQRAARKHRNAIQPDDLQHSRRGPRIGRRIRVVDTGDDYRSGILCIRLSHVPWQGEAGRGRRTRILEPSAFVFRVARAFRAVLFRGGQKDGSVSAPLTACENALTRQLRLRLRSATGLAAMRRIRQSR